MLHIDIWVVGLGATWCEDVSIGNILSKAQLIQDFTFISWMKQAMIFYTKLNFLH